MDRVQEPQQDLAVRAHSPSPTPLAHAGPCRLSGPLAHSREQWGALCGIGAGACVCRLMLQQGCGTRRATLAQLCESG